MNDIIKHQGIVENINGTHIRVKIVQTSACSSCAANKYCKSAESKEKIIDVYTNNASSFQIGDNVYVYGTTTMGMRAIFWAFAVPFLIIISVLFITIKVTSGQEVFSALSAIFSLGLYYLILYMCKDRLGKKFVFSIKSINN